jgi:signal peptidase
MGKLGRTVATTVLVTVAACAAAVIVAQLAGWMRLDEVQGGSMEPTITNGSLLVTVRADVDEISADDVVSIVVDGGKRVTHRVVDVDHATGQVVTRGDANNVADPTPYTGERVDRVVAALPGLGVVARYGSEAVRGPLLMLAAALSVVLAVDAAVTGRRRRGEVLQHELVLR